MIILMMGLLGLTLGSFINAFVWRFHAGKDWISARSECINCHHVLAGRDLVPIVSWLALKGKCRYCKRSISVQYPLIEAITAIAFIISYIFWPLPISHLEVVIFALWIVILTGLIALAVYDIKWMLLPNKIVYSLIGLAIVMAILSIMTTHNKLGVSIGYFASCAIGGGLFYLLFQLSRGKWIGGGDVRLGFLLGILASTPGNSFLLIFLAAALGSLVSLPLILSGKMKRSSVIPFGPFLIASSFIVQFTGSSIVQWYLKLFIPR